MRIAHLSDIHFGTENREAVAAAAEWLNASSPDLTVISGDVTAFGTVPEFDAAAAWIAALPGPRLVIPGNHDTPYLGIWKRLTNPFELFGDRFGPPDHVMLDVAGARVAGVNTSRGAQVRLNWSKGAIGPDQVRAALADLNGAPAGALRVLACHHPLSEMIGGPMTARVRGGERAAKAFCGGHVDVILTGHIHAPFAMALPHDDGCTYAVGAGTLSLRERAAPAGFNVLNIDDTVVAVTALAWTGSGLEPWREWSLPRRGAQSMMR